MTYSASKPVQRQGMRTDSLLLPVHMTALALASLPLPACADNPGIYSGLDDYIIAGAASIALSIIAAVYAFIKLRGSMAKRLFTGIAVLVLGLPICGIASLIIINARNNVRRHHEELQYKKSEQEKQSNWEKLSLRVAACNAQLPALKQELASGQYSQDIKIHLVEDCAVAKTNPAVLGTMLDDLLNTEQAVNKTTHCAYLNPVLRSLDTRLLQEFVNRKLSLLCSSPAEYGQTAPSWWDIWRYSAPPLPHQQLVTGLRYLEQHGIDLKQVVGERSLLSLAFERCDVNAIHFALDLGMDPYPDPASYNLLSAAQTWTLQRFSHLCNYSSAESAGIQARMRDLSSQEADALAAKMHIKLGLESMRNGGADFFSYLLARGVALERLSTYGIPYSTTAISPELGAALNQLSDQQLAKLICPVDDKGEHQNSLYQEAIRSNNQVLVDLLKKRKMKPGCERGQVQP